MRIIIISKFNIKNRLYWSGTINSVYYSLKKNKNFNIIRIDNLNNSLRKLYAIKRDFLKYTRNIKYDETYNINVAKNFAEQINKKLESFKNKKVDYILCFDTSLISYLQTNIPIILWTDLLYTDYYDHYFNDLKITKETIDSIKIIEKKAIKKCHKVLLATNWAIKRAKKKYEKSSNKFKLLPFGPNLKTNISKNIIYKNIERRPKKKLCLITLSVNWKRKGIDKILKLHKILTNAGINTKITIIGVKRHIKNLHKDIKLVGFVDKNTKLGEKKISKYLLRNHFHILFSNAEAYGISLVEANSRGLPNLGFKVGGINQIVKNGINGRLFEKNTELKNISSYIIKTHNNNKMYRKLAMSSYNYYDKNFRYNKIINKFLNLIK